MDELRQLVSELRDLLAEECREFWDPRTATLYGKRKKSKGGCRPKHYQPGFAGLFTRGNQNNSGRSGGMTTANTGVPYGGGGGAAGGGTGGTGGGGGGGP